VSKGKPAPPSPNTSVEEERRLYEREYASVRPLKPTPARIPLVPSPSRPVSPPAVPTAPLRSAWVIKRQDGRVSASAAGVAHEQVSALARGELPVEATCDLHGMRAEAARARLAGFLAGCADRGQRVVLVVCGRGLHSGPEGPVLLDVAIDVLTGTATGRQVLAFTSASPRQGGEGALVVWLRKRRA
jgi:DNA-nicking Smr family endonuclease